MVPADSARIPRVPAYSGAVSVSYCISPTGLSPAAALLSRRFGYAPAVHSLTVLQPRSAPKRGRFGLLHVRSPLLAQSLVYFLFLRVLRCFSSPGSPLPMGDTGMKPVGCPIRKSADQWIFAPARSLSQLITSFVASESQGILHVPLSPFFMTLVFFNRFEHHSARSLKSSCYCDSIQRNRVASCFA